MQVIEGASPNPVIHPTALSPIENHARLPENAEMEGQPRLGCAHGVGQVADTSLPITQQIEDLQSCWIGQRMKEPGAEREGVGGHEKQYINFF